jgi:hypothetical protein
LSRRFADGEEGDAAANQPGNQSTNPYTLTKATAERRSSVGPWFRRRGTHEKSEAEFDVPGGGPGKCWPAAVRAEFSLADSTHLPAGACRTHVLRPESRDRQSTIVPLRPRHRAAAEQIVNMYAGQPLATRGALRSLRWSAPRPTPSPLGPAYRDPAPLHAAKHFAPVVHRLAKASAPPQPGMQKPRWDKPVRVQDYMRPRQRPASTH